MKVSISIPGTWHGFQLAKQLNRRDSLKKIYTSYPQFYVDSNGIDPSKISSIKHAEAVMQLGTRIPVIDSLLASVTPWARPTERIKGHLFDRAVARDLKRNRPDIFVGMAGTAGRSTKVANSQGVMTVAERLCSHIRTQNRILTEEYERHNVNETPVSESHIEREEQVYAAADYISVPSEFIYNSFIQQGIPKKKLLLEKYPVNFDTFSPGGCSDDTIRYLFAGGVSLRKGIPDLLSAWEMADLDDAELLIAGSVDSHVKELVSRFSGDSSVRFLGWVEDIENMYRVSDIFVLPSIEDGFGKVVIEAMASGLPAIVSENTGAKDCIENNSNGVIVPVRDPETLADVMTKFHQNPERVSRMGDSARDYILDSDYSEDQYGERIYHKYKSLY